MATVLALVFSPALFGGLSYRWIGPAVMGGRIDAVAGVAGNPAIVYLGHSSGGLWKSSDGGLTFASVFNDGGSTAIGAIALEPQNPNVIYAGTGEAFPRNTADYGDGLWKSADGAKHWHHLGLRGVGSIAKIAVDPRDARIVLVAALGHEFAPSTQRGIFRSTDGGAHFTRVLYVNATTGGSDLSFDPKDPRIVYAGTFDFLRRPWHLRSGGPGSGLWRSADAGKTWVRLTDPRRRDGLPGGAINRVGVSVCAGDPRVVYAFVPVKHGMLYRSTDGGAHWSLRNASYAINFRPFYFSQVRCDPRDASRVYAVAGALMLSNDGGKTFASIGGGGDNHDLWIDPDNPLRLLDGSDMGFHYSVNRGKTWDYDDVVPFAQVYRVGYDFARPYHVLAGMQDHEVWRGPSTLWSTRDGAGNGSWLNISDWGDGQYAMADPRDSQIVYEDTHFGDLVRADLRTGERRYISPQPIVAFGTGAGAYPYRFSWSAPLLISHFNPDVIYFGGNVLFKSIDQGDSWRVVSPDLTHCPPSELGPSGGPVTLDDTNAETYCTIYTVAEDAADPKTLWIGTDNGHLDITRDGGETWTSLSANVPGLTQPARVAAIAASATRPGVAYAAFDRHEFDDYRPYAYVTTDYGKTWENISAGLPAYVHVVREDPRNPRVLYAATERGVDVSFDAGGHWSDLRLGLPRVPVFDLQVQPRDDDLIVGSHGRGLYVLDDLTPLQELARAARHRLFLFAPPPAVRYTNVLYHEHGRGAFVAPNRPYGALISFYLAAVPAAPGHKRPHVTVRIFDARGALVDRFAAPARAGINRTVWDLHALPPGGASARDPRPYYVFYPMKLRGAQVLPGVYRVEIDALGKTADAPLTVEMDPHDPVTLAALRAHRSAVETLVRRQAAAQTAIARLSTALEQLRTRERGRAPADVRAEMTAFGRELQTQLDGLRNPDSSGYRAPAQLTEQLAYLRDTIAQYDGPPTQTQNAFILRYGAQVDAVVARVNALLGPRLLRLNARLRAAGLKPLAARRAGVCVPCAE